MKNPIGRFPAKTPQLMSKWRRRHGFALVITLSLMVLLVMLGVGLLSLASKSLSISGRQSELAEARANARLALSLAIAQLQKQTGPDQRITVTADQLSSGADGGDSSAAEGRKHWTGVYDAWASTAESRPSPDFRTWLVSGETTDLSGISTAKTSTGEEIELVGAGTVGDLADGAVKVPVIEIEQPGGEPARLAWWTGDQGVKAAIATPTVPEDDSLAAVRAGLQSAPRNAIEFAQSDNGQPFADLDTAEPRLMAVTGWKQSGFLASEPDAPRGLFHDLAASSTGLLTNVREGGFRKDLSMQLERPVSSARSMALYTVNRETGINFQELRGYYQLYKELQSRGGASYTTGGRIGSNTPFLQLEASAAACRNDDNFFFKQPVIISYQMVLSFETRVVSGRPRLHVVADPVVTFWNPLDVPVVVPRSTFFSIKYWQIPYDLYLGIDGGGVRKYPLAASLSGAFSGSNGDGNYLSLQAGALQQLVFKPGEVIKVSQSGTAFVGNPGEHKLAGRAGFNYGGGVSLPVRDTSGGYVDLRPTSTITYEVRANNLTAGKKNGSGNSVTGADAHTRHFSLTHHECYVGEDRGSNSLGYGGMYIDWDFGNRRLRAGEVRGETQPGTKSRGERLYADRNPQVFKPIVSQDTRPLTVAELGGRKAPFMMVSYNAKTEMGSDLGTRYLSRFNPRALHVDFYDLSETERDMLPYEFSVEPLVSWKNRSLEVSTNGNAYFGGGMNAEFGNSFVSTHSIPREPIVSIAAFQHSCANGFEVQRPTYGYATLNGREPLLPQISHAIGNSMAPSMMEKNQTEGSLPGGRPMADHSYLANQGLWDEWFFSGIAPQLATTFGKRRAQRQVGEEFLDGSGQLPVVRYLPDTAGVEVDSIFSSFFSGSTPNDKGISTIASLIRVDGLFNVNSTSVEAWKAMLGGLNDRPVVVRDETGAESLEQGNGEVPVANLHGPRNAVIDADGNLDVKESSQWVGRRTLSEEEIDELAREIVKEVRRRGPFLSLADFVNRRLGSDDELARSGAIQSALDSDDVSINAAFRSSGRAVAGGTAGRFAFPEAEEGPAGFGSPGVVKQADILTPIAPVLSVRSDSFIVRAYGESVDREGKVVARAWCEATVERDKNFIDPADNPETAIAGLSKPVNETFGRRYQVVSFRWMHPDEI
ncbi:hypothetical protein [Luteolibacter marinus]|uniref:hypothetical protein n=1 Tax=Luteolibacter marinus TaxID=2776705 RepID=UPI0018686E7B|nr:hypothetical protein [Luteolibacter marinus]